MAHPIGSALWIRARLLRERWRRLAPVLVVALSIPVLAHHLSPEHEGMGMGAMPTMHDDHGGHADAMSTMAAPCLGTVEAPFMLVALGGAVLLARWRTRTLRRPARRVIAAAGPPRAPPPHGPPTFLRLGVLLT